MSEKKSNPYENIFKPRSIAKVSVKVIFNLIKISFEVSTKPFIARVMVFASTNKSIKLS